MNLDHLQATHLVQKLDWTLRKDGKHDFGAVEVAVLPPFTDLRSVQTLIDGDRLEPEVRRPGPVGARPGAYTGEIRGVPRQARLHLRRGRAQ
jgi:triosephosphate isomerase